MSPFIFSLSITLVLIISILPLSTAYLVDIDGDPIFNGRAYYIIPITTSSGLTYTQYQNKCPLYITPEKTENSPGTPVQIFSDIGSRFIELNQHASLSFKGPTPCGTYLQWNQTLDMANSLVRKLYITAGKDGSRILGHNPFSITKTDKSLIPIYEIKYRSLSGEKVNYNVGLYEDGLLGITEYPTSVFFKKAFNILELSTS